MHSWNLLERGPQKNMERSTDGGGRPMEVAFGGMLLYGTLETTIYSMYRQARNTIIYNNLQSTNY